MVRRLTSPTQLGRKPNKAAVPALERSKDAAGIWQSPTMRLIGLGVLAVAFAFFIMNAIFGDNGWMVSRRQRKQIESLSKEIDRLQNENRDLEKQIQGLRSNPKVIDRMAHDQLQMVAPNQTIYTLPDQDPKEDPKPQPTGSPATTTPAKR